LAILLANSTGVYAKTSWKKILRDFKVPKADQAYCLMDEGVVKGSNVHKKIRLASVSKLFTTLWAIEKLKVDYQFETTFYLQGKHLHIEGGRDPVFSRRKFYFLVSQLNNLGIKKLDKITFDKNMRVFANVEINPQAEVNNGDILDKSRINIKDFLHTPAWDRIKTDYRNFAKTTPNRVLKELQIRKSLGDISLRIGSVYQLNKFPFKSRKKTIRKFSHRSPEIIKYLKVMNIVSNNFIADQIFMKLGGEKGFDAYIKPFIQENFPDYKQQRSKFKKGEANIKMFTGSGLDSRRNNKRVDNFTTCAIAVKLIEKLQMALEAQEILIQKAVAVPGVDKGSFKRRLKTPRVAKKLVAKTGTLRHTSSLAGMINTKKGSVYFGIFNHLLGVKGKVRLAQNKMVRQFLDQYDGGKKLIYTSEYFFPAYETLEEVPY
jgi:serine-type D-Ala-D-Ala carboxypeptidase/endopeptidase (penicillin-binding protein 4)